MGQTFVLGRVARTDPRVRERESVGPTVFPCPRRRDAHDVDPQPKVADEPGADLTQLLDRLRPIGELGTESVRFGPQVRVALGDLPGADGPAPACLANAHGIAPELVARDHV